MGNRPRFLLGIAIAILLMGFAASARTPYASGIRPHGADATTAAPASDSTGWIAALGLVFVYGTGLALGARGPRRRSRPDAAVDDGGLRRLQHVKSLLRGRLRPATAAADARRDGAARLSPARESA